MPVAEIPPIPSTISADTHLCDPAARSYGACDLPSISSARTTRREVRRHSSLARVSRCGAAAHRPVSVDSSGRLSGVMTCESVWVCPVCSRHRRQDLAAEISQAVSAWRSQGFSVVSVRLSLPHGYLDDQFALGEAWDQLHALWPKVSHDRSWRRVRQTYGIAHTLVIEEVSLTRSGRGWHPHVHALLFVTRKPTAGYLAGLRDWFRRRPKTQELAGGVLDRHGAHVAVADGEAEAIGRYYAKPRGAEEAFTQLTDRPQPQIGRWWAYEQASRGRRVAQWSTGAQSALCRTTHSSRTTDHIPEPVVLAHLSPRLFRLLARRGLEPDLSAAARAGPSALRCLLESEGATQHWQVQGLAQYWLAPAEPADQLPSRRGVGSCRAASRDRTRSTPGPARQPW